MKCYWPQVYFATEIEDKNNEEFMEVITLSLTRGTTFLVTIARVNCNTLIDIGATRSCKSEMFYNQLVLPWLLMAFHLVVTSASVQWVLYNVHLNSEDIPLSSISLSVRT